MKNFRLLLLLTLLIAPVAFAQNKVTVKVLSSQLKRVSLSLEPTFW